MTTLNDIQSEIAGLPPDLRAEVLNFVRLVKARHGLLSASPASAPDTGDSAFFQAIEAAGFVGCVDTDEQLSSTFKNRLDFSAKCGTRA